MRRLPLLLAMLASLPGIACAQDAPATQPGVGRFPNMSVDVKHRQIRVDCEALNVDIRLEFFCVLDGTNEHESVLRTAARPSDIHTALLMLGMVPGEPVHYSEAAKTWLPPHGPPLHISCEYMKDGKLVQVPAYRMLRNADTKKVPNAFTWIFAGSKVMDDGKYAADITGYVVSVVNFDLSMIDVPQLASNANETLEWEYNPDTVPKTGTPVTMIIEPAGGAPAADTTQPAHPPATPEPAVLKLRTNGTMDLDGQPVTLDGLAAALKNLPPERKSVRLAAANDADPDRVQAVQAAIAAAGKNPEAAAPSAAADPASPDLEPPISSVHENEQDIADLKAKWDKVVKPNAAAMQQAAQAHYEVISAMRKEQQRLINEADRIQRAIDELEKQYQDMTTPRPENPQ